MLPLGHILESLGDYTAAGAAAWAELARCDQALERFLSDSAPCFIMLSKWPSGGQVCNILRTRYFWLALYLSLHESGKFQFGMAMHLTQDVFRFIVNVIYRVNGCSNDDNSDNANARPVEAELLMKLLNDWPPVLLITARVVLRWLNPS